MCMGISCEVIWGGQRIDAKFGDPNEDGADRDSHCVIRKICGIAEANTRASSTRHARLECHPSTTLDDVDGYRLVFDEGERPAWWTDEIASEFRSRHLRAEVARRMDRVRANGVWPGSLRPVKDCVLPDALTSIGGSADFRGWTGSADALTSIGGSADFRSWTGSADALTSIGGPAYFSGWTGSADALTSIGGSADFRGWTGSADALTSIGGSADFRRLDRLGRRVDEHRRLRVLQSAGPARPTR